MPAPVQWETVAVPFAQGIQPSAQARLLDQGKLLTAQNCFYSKDQGPQKRNGHTEHRLRGATPLIGLSGTTPPAVAPYRAAFSTENPGLAASWLFGWGILDSTHTTSTASYAVSQQAHPGLLFGQTARDNEVIPWDGHRLYSYAAQQTTLFGDGTGIGADALVRGPAVMPALRSAPFAKTSQAQFRPDACDNGRVKTAAWVVDDAATPVKVQYQAVDSVTGAALGGQVFACTDAIAVRVMTSGPWTHMVINDNGALLLKSFHQDTPDTIVAQSLGTANLYDLEKINETSWLIVGSLTAGPTVTVYVMEADGTIGTSWVADVAGAAPLTIAISIDHNNIVALAWEQTTADPDVKFRTYTLGGTPISATIQVGNLDRVNASRVTLAPQYMLYLDGGGVKRTVWMVFAEDVVSSVSATKVWRVEDGGTVTLVDTRHRVFLGSHAFRVGNRVFVWCVNNNPLQATWFLCDEYLLPVGKMDFGLADYAKSNSGSILVTGTYQQMLPGVNWHVESADHPYKDRLVFHGCLPYKTRVTSSQAGVQPNGVFAESSIRYYELDFLPSMRSAQAGRCAYMAGAQLWAFDGNEVVEAGFHSGPQISYPAQTSVTVIGGVEERRYRVDLCHRNAQGEEVRSWSLISEGITQDTGITISIEHQPMTRREDSYFLVFRTEGIGSVYHLVSSRDPSDSGAAANGYVANDRNSATYTFIDNITDTALLAKEYHPANAPLYLEPLPAPACEVIAVGRDRVWLSGGELAPGEVAPSRYFLPGETPSFSPALNIQVDRNVEPVTAVAFVGDIGFFFQRTRTYLLDSDGPNNVLQGGWLPVRLALADVGAVGPEGVALTTQGLYFQSPAGLRMLGPNGGLTDFGRDMDPLAQGALFSAAVVIPQHTQIRWYSRLSSAPSLVYDYSSGNWGTWTGVDCVGACYWAPGQVAILSRPDATLWRETTGRWTDGDRSYEMVVKTAWFRPGNAGDFYRMKRFVLWGSGFDLTLRFRLFYDEQESWEEEMNVALVEGNGTGWGDATWGAGSWGYALAGYSSALWFQDGLFRIKRRPGRQKCSVFAIEMSDKGVNGPGFSPTVLGLELGRKMGLDRVPRSS